MAELCEYFLYFTYHLMEIVLQLPGFEEHDFSPELIDRSVSVIALAVPLGLYFLCLFMIALAGLCLYKFVGGRRK